MITNDWAEKIEGEYKKPYYKSLYETVVREYRTKEIFPASKDIFKAYDLCPYHK